MAEGILVLRTPPGRGPRPGQTIRVGTYEVIYLYRLLPPILDHDDLQVAVTPSAPLIQMVGQTFADRHIDPVEIEAFDSGAAAWEFVAGQRDTVRDEPDGPLRLETIPELVARLEAEWAIRKAQAMADWTAEHEHAGRRLTP